MNTQYDELETLVGTELRDRAGDVDGARLTFTDVRGRVRRIRRRRQAGVGVAVAAALAIAVPLGLSGGGSLDSTERIDPAVPDRQEVVRTTFSTAGLDRGAAPAVEYFTEEGVVLPEQGVQPLPENWQALVPGGPDGGWVALSPTKDDVVVLSEDFQRVSEQPSNQVLISNPDRSLLAWTVPGADSQTLVLRPTADPSSGSAWELPPGPVVQPVGFVSDASLLYESTGPEGAEAIGVAHEDGTTSTFEGDWLGAISASPATGLVAVQTKTNPDASGCFGVVDPSVSTAKTLWDTCGYSLGTFSPDGRYVLASGPYQSGSGLDSLSILDARTGALVTNFQSERGTMIPLSGVVWETADTIIAVANEVNSWTVLRFGVDGRVEETTDPRNGSDYPDTPFFLSADRRPL